MVGGEDQHLFGHLSENALRVLKNCVSRAEIPALAGLLHGWDNFDVFTQLGRENAPPVAHMPDELERFVLREHEDSAQVGINAIGKREIDNAVLAAKWHGGFGGIAGQGMKALPGASSQ